MRKSVVAMLCLSCALVLGATVLHEPVANAAAAVLKMAIVEPLDADGRVKVSQADFAGPRLPFQHSTQCTFTSTVCSVDVAVPAGYLLVVETMSFMTFVPTTSRVDLVRVLTVLDGKGAFLAIPMAHTGTVSGPLSQFATTASFKAYVDYLQIIFNSDGGTNDRTAAVNVFGYLVPKP